MMNLMSLPSTNGILFDLGMGVWTHRDVRNQFWFKSLNDRSSRPEVFCKKIVLRNFTKFTGKHLCQSLFIKSEACNFIKKETLAQVCPCEFCEISKNTFFIEHLWATASVVPKTLLSHVFVVSFLILIQSY